MTIRSQLVKLAYMNQDLRPHLIKIIASARHAEWSMMSESDFWSIIQSIGWGTRTTNPKTIRERLQRQLSPNQAQQMRDTFKDLHSGLFAVLRSNQMFPPGFNRLEADDLIAHIIGLGKLTYYKVRDNPQLATEMGSNGEYNKGFGEAIPTKYDPFYKSTPA